MSAPPLPFTPRQPTPAPALSRQAAHDLIGRMQFANTAGISFGGHRDTYRAFGYPRHEIHYREFLSLYRRGDIAARIVEAYPQALWAVPPRLTDDGDPDVTTAFERDYVALYTDLGVWSAIMKAHILACIGHYSILWLGAEGDPSESLDKGADIKALMPVSEDDAAIGAFDTNPRSERFQQPEFYNLSLTGWSGHVHWSRVIHVAAKTLNSRVHGEPLLGRVFNRLLDYEKVIGGGSEAAFRHMDKGMVLNKDEDAEVTPEARADLVEQLDNYLHVGQRYIFTNGLDVTPMGSDVPNFGPNVDAIIKVIAGAVGIPTRILLGSEQAKLAASQDSKNWNKRVAEQATYFGEPLIRQLNDAFVMAGMLGDVDYEVQWPPMDAPSPEDRAKTAERWAKANVAQVNASGQVILTSDEIRKDVVGKQPLDEDQQPTPRDAAATNAEWDAVREAAEGQVGAYATAIIGTWTTSVESLDPDTVIAEIDTQLIASLPPVTLSTMANSGNAVLEVDRNQGSLFRTAVARQGQFDLEFNATNPRAVNWAETRVGELINEIGPDTLDTIRAVVTRGQTQGLTPVQQATELRKVVGLRADQLAAVDALEDRLMSAAVGSVVTAGDRLIAVPSQISPAFIEDQLATYSTDLRNQRALMIARTETMRAANQGQLELWRQAQDVGGLPAGVKRIWLANTERHQDMEGRPTDIGRPFLTPEGTPLEPGQEPNCGCSQGLVG